MRRAAGMFTHACRCGATQLDVAVPGPGAGTYVVCYCTDCQTAARLHKGGADILTPAGGTHVWQTAPAHITRIAGADHLEILRLTPRGAFRWHARCCGTPMINTLPSLGMPFSGIVLRQSELPDIVPLLGPVTCHYSTLGARPGAGAPAQDSGVPRAILQVGWRILRGLVPGNTRRNPLRRADGSPAAPIRVVPPEARLAAAREIG
ncbi:DUF6151 family protein [Rhodobacteraceae bacterium KMM 6894]|nr:DUF6151 family protein [Rhodobacteraceae bacterium KMM 6894]